MQARKIFNPLAAAAREESVSGADEAGVAVDEGTPLRVEASLTNVDVGVCPKCKKSMTRATIADGASVFYCVADRVAMPLPNEMLG